MNLDDMCDDAFWCFASMSESASLIALKTMLKEKNINSTVGDI